MQKPGRTNQDIYDQMRLRGEPAGYSAMFEARKEIDDPNTAVAFIDGYARHLKEEFPDIFTGERDPYTTAATTMKELGETAIWEKAAGRFLSNAS